MHLHLSKSSDRTADGVQSADIHGSKSVRITSWLPAIFYFQSTLSFSIEDEDLLEGARCIFPLFLLRSNKNKDSAKEVRSLRRGNFGV